MNSRFLSLAALIVAIIIFFAYVSPTWSGSITATKAAIALDDQALTTENEYVTQENTLTASENTIDPADLQRLSVFLPDSVDNVGLILDLNELAARSGLSLANIDVAAADANGSNTITNGSQQGTALAATTNPVGSVDLSLSANGTFAALQTFLSGIERSERLLDVQNIAITGSNTGVYGYQMSLRLYWLQ